MEEFKPCPFCGTPNRVDARFCRRCGKAQTVPAVAEPSSDIAPAVSGTTDAPSPASAPPTSADLPPPNPVMEDAATPAIELLAPLAPGTRLYERFEILEVLESANGVTRYRARDAMRCAQCHTENQPTESFCVNCGAELGESRGTCILEESRVPQDMATVPANAFAWENRLYVIQFEPPPTQTKTPFARGVHLTFGCASDAGLVRADTPDEDSVFAGVFTAIYESVAQPTLGLFIVADGIGGAEAGHIASKAGVQTAVARLMQDVITRLLAGETLSDEAVREAIHAAIQAANKKVFEIAQATHPEMGTTMTLALVINGNAYVANVGDSRTYLLAGTRLQQITRDHSLVANLVAKGEIQPEEIYTHPHRNYILRSLGANENVEVDLFPPDGGALKLQPGARLLLCCDGLWEMVRDDELERFLFSTDTPQTICERLVTRANENGGEDNISVIVVDVA